MRRVIVVAFALVMMFAVAASGFAFDWISFPNTSTEMMARASAGFGSLVFVPIEIMPFGAAFETKLPFLDGLSAGIGASVVVINYDPPGDDQDATAATVGTGAYGKYIFLSDEQMEEAVGLPLSLGAAAGFGWRFEALSGDLGGNYETSGYQALAVALLGYKADRWFATLYGGYIDRGWGVSGEFAFSLTDTMHLGLFWIPLIGLGATFTLQF